MSWGRETGKFPGCSARTSPDPLGRGVHRGTVRCKLDVRSSRRWQLLPFVWVDHVCLNSNIFRRTAKVKPLNSGHTIYPGHDAFHNSPSLRHSTQKRRPSPNLKYQSTHRPLVRDHSVALGTRRPMTLPTSCPLSCSSHSRAYSRLHVPNLKYPRGSRPHRPPCRSGRVCVFWTGPATSDPRKHDWAPLT